MFGWVELQALIKWLPTITQPPLVDFRVFGQPAQSVSECTSKWDTSCQRNCQINLGRPTKNLANLLRLCSPSSVGELIHLQISLAAWAQSGLSAAR